MTAPRLSPSGIPYLILPAAERVASEAARLFVKASARAAAESRRFAVALAGGSTPRLLYQLLAEGSRSEGIDWGRVEIFFGDERAVGPEHAESNFRMAREALLKRVALDPDNIHRMKGEAEDAQKEARRYEALLRSRLPTNEEGWPRLDLVLLGLGSDGHTASLFPGTQALRESEACVANNAVPHLGTRRLTLTFPVLNAARLVLFLVCGSGKSGVARAILGGSGAGSDAPAGRIRPGAGELLWLLDAEASHELDRSDGGDPDEA